MSAAKPFPLFVQNNTPREVAIDLAALPYILLFNQQTGEYERIVLQCGDRPQREKKKA